MQVIKFLLMLDSYGNFRTNKQYIGNNVHTITIVLLQAF